MEPVKKFVYQIRRKRDGLCSTGGSYPRFSVKGKVWSGLGPLRNHLRLISDHGKSYAYAECEIVRAEIVATIDNVMGIADVVGPPPWNPKVKSRYCTECGSFGNRHASGCTQR